MKNVKNYTGHKFGDLTILEQIYNEEGNHKVVCQCSCGKIVTKNRYNVIYGRSTNCGCKHNKKRNRIEIKSGDVFGRLTIVEKAKDVKKSTSYICECTCGEIKEVMKGNLTSGKIKSCGCIAREYMQERSLLLKEKKEITTEKKRLEKRKAYVSKNIDKALEKEEIFKTIFNEYVKSHMNKAEFMEFRNLKLQKFNIIIRFGKKENIETQISPEKTITVSEIMKRKDLSIAKFSKLLKFTNTNFLESTISDEDKRKIRNFFYLSDDFEITHR